jgi:hypothetical protein
MEQLLVAGTGDRRGSRTMFYVLLAEHTPDICPQSNTRTREFMMKAGPEMMNVAKRHGVTVVSGPYVSREHLSVVVLDSPKAESVDSFISESGLAAWNRVRVVPSQTLADGMKEMEHIKPIF